VLRAAASPLEHWLVKGSRRTRFHLKNRLIAAGLKEPRCESCGIERWLGAPLIMALHHVNGDPEDNRLENLQLLCPNCHSQTDNFSGRNRGRRAAREGTAP
jgi:5-methylcytosine-specific restriction endonuclease McrA